MGQAKSKGHYFTIMSITGHKTTSVFKRYNTIEEADVVAASRRLQAYLESEKGKITDRDTA